MIDGEELIELISPKSQIALLILILEGLEHLLEQTKL